MAKKQAETARVQTLQTLRRTLTGKYSEQTLYNMESMDEEVVNKVSAAFVDFICLFSM